MEADGDIDNATRLTTSVTTSAMSPERDGVGAFLRARRLELGMSHVDVAVLVKLPARRIAAMEDERWEELPEGPYLRGFLRNIARALQLDAATLMDRVGQTRVRSRSADSILVAPGSTHAMMPRRSGPSDGRHNGRALIFGAFAFALIAALIAWSGTASFDRMVDGGKALLAARPTGPDDAAGKRSEAGADGSTTPATSPSNAGTDGSVAADGPLPAAPAPAQEAASTTPASPAALQGAAQAASPASGAALTFHFNEDSWVEVRAADGKILLQQLNVAGSDQQIGGEAPFTLIVGNAKGVALKFRGKPVDLAPYTRTSVARLSLS